MGRPRKISPPVNASEDNSALHDRVEVTGTSTEPVHLGDGRTLAKGEKAMVSSEVAKILRDNGRAE